MNRSTPGLPVHHQLPEFTQTHIHRVCDAIQPSHPLSSPFPPAPNPSQHQSGLVESLCSPRNSQESSPTQQFKSIKSLVLGFMVQLSHPYMTTGETKALTRRTFVGKVMSLLLNMLSRLVITFLPRSNSSFNFMAAVTICGDFGAPPK